MQERRNANRMLCAELVELFYRDADLRYHRQIVNLDDISQHGACIQLDNCVADGTRVRLLCKGDELAGVVRYCAFQGHSYVLGIEFIGKSQWTPESFLPEHLLDPRTLDS